MVQSAKKQPMSEELIRRFRLRLTVILGYIEHLSRRKDLPTDVRHELEVVERQAWELNKLLDDAATSEGELAQQEKPR